MPAIALHYENSRATIAYVLRGIRRWYGHNDMEELESIALVAYCEAMENPPDYARKNMDGYIRLVIQRRVVDTIRKESRRIVPYWRRTSADSVDLWAVIDPAHKFSTAEFLEELSEDARICAGLALDNPISINHDAQSLGGTPRNFRRVIRKHLMDLGWTAQRVRESFAEVAELLKTF